MKKKIILIIAGAVALLLVLTLILSLTMCGKKPAIEELSSLPTSSEETTSVEESSEPESTEAESSAQASSTSPSSAAAASSKAASSSKAQSVAASIAPSQAQSTAPPVTPTNNFPKTAKEFLSALQGQVNTSGYTTSTATSDKVNGLSGVTTILTSNRTGHVVKVFCPQARLGTDKWTSCIGWVLDSQGNEVISAGPVAVSEGSLGKTLGQYR